jgi:hypothetical protein
MTDRDTLLALAEPDQLLLANSPCAQCLTTRNRIVPGDRAANIVRSCRTEGVHFRCHKGDIAGLVVHCRGVHDAIGGSKAYRFAKMLGLPVVGVDADDLPALRARAGGL